MATYRKPLVDKDGNYIIPVVDSMDDYSTEEVDTQRKWIDGKTIYKKTIECGALPNNNSKSTNHDISNISEVVKIEAIAIASGAYFLLPQATPVALTYQCSLSVSNTVVTIRTGTDYSNYNGYVTLYYTKTS